MSNRSKKTHKDLTTQEIPNLGIMAMRSSPLPPPAEVERYESLYSGVTKLLFDNFIKQSEHRMKIETIVIESDIKKSKWGQWISGALALICIASGSILTYLGKDVVGLSLIFGSIGTLLTAFYGGAILRYIERVKKDKEKD